MENKSASTFLFQLAKRKSGALCLLFLLIFISSSSYAAEGVITVAVSQSIYHSGIISYIIPLFEKKMPYRIKAIRVSNEEAVIMGKAGKADLLFINASPVSDKFIANGFGVNRGRVMHNFSIFIGPKDDPAGIRGRDPIGAFRKIEKGGYPFVSCSDCPDIIKMEVMLWKEAGILPDVKWYIQGTGGMEANIKTANLRSAYALCDRAEYLMLRDKISLDLLVDRHPALFNQYIIIEVNPERFLPVNSAGSKAFTEFLLSGDGEDIIRRFGVDRYGDELFYPQ